jgi:hypothetical protein
MTYQLEEPFFEDKGKIMVQKEIGDNKTQMTFSSNGTIKGNIEVTNSGDLVSLSKGNKGTSAQGQGVSSSYPFDKYSSIYRISHLGEVIEIMDRL